MQGNGAVGLVQKLTSEGLMVILIEDHLVTLGRQNTQALMHLGQHGGPLVER